MSAPTENPDAERPRPDEGRCAELTLESGDLVFYDTDNRHAWLQSDAPVDLSAAV